MRKDQLILRIKGEADASPLRANCVSLVSYPYTSTVNQSFPSLQEQHMQ